MRVKVELSRSVCWDLQHRFAADADSFYTELRRIEEDPLRHSEFFYDPGLRFRELRIFRFGRGVKKIAIFVYYRLRGLIRVIECRLSKPRRSRDAGADEGGASP